MVIKRAVREMADRLAEIAFLAKESWKYPRAWIEMWTDELAVSAGYVSATAVFAAMESDDIVGWCAISDDGNCWSLEHCWVDPSAMGRGVGRELIRAAIREIVKNGGQSIMVLSAPNAELSYQKLGFSRIGEHKSRPAGRLLPVLKAGVIDIR